MRTRPPQDRDAAARRIRPPVLLTGFGLGAFADGIVLHQLLQWHHLVSAQRPVDDLDALQHNTFWDGVFHAGSWLVVVAGLVWLARVRPELRQVPLRRVAGWTLVGWGAFHVVDEVVFHVLLEAHHIRMVEDYLVYDLAYTAIGVVLALVGLRLARPDDADG